MGRGREGLNYLDGRQRFRFEKTENFFREEAGDTTAHIRKTDGMEQSVQEHCANTAALAAVFAENLGLKNFAMLCGMMHDIGKLSSAFSEYIHGSGGYARGSIDHSFAGAKYLYSLGKSNPSRELAACSMGRVILSHHSLHDWIDEDGEDYFAERIDKTDFYEETIENAKQLSFFEDIGGILKSAESEYKALGERLKNLVTLMDLPVAEYKKEALAFYHGMAERLICSILMDADRIDTADFMSGSPAEVPEAPEVTFGRMQENLEKKLKELNQGKDPVSLWRDEISEQCGKFAEHPVGICRLVVPTGGGKTLSSLRFAIRQCQLFGKKKIIYVAPFMSIIEQNSDVIRSLCGNSAFLEHHSDAIGRAAESKNGEELDEYELHADRWDTPVIATTMVQFLNTLFLGRTSSVRRLHRLSEAVIIIDEIQSLPLRCTYLFSLAMNFLSKICKSTIVLCSATQPPFELLERFPLLLDRDPDMVKVDAQGFSPRTKLINLVNNSGYSFDEAANFCLEKQRENQSVLMIVNTKSAAREIYKRLKNLTDVELIHLSTGMCPEHRRKKIDLAREKLRNHEPMICVTTQLIEAGVDISFGCVIRSLAGLDNISQAAGRCNRNGEFGRACPVYLLNIRDEKLGRLKEISTAQVISREMLESPCGDILSGENLSVYFGKIYRENKNELVYPCADDNLIDLMGLNRERSILGGKKAGLHGQAFATAGRIFEAISNHSLSLLSPYYKKDKNADKFVSYLKEETSPNRVGRLSRALQPYTIEVYPEQMKTLLERNGVIELPAGVAILREEYYNDDYGLSIDEPEIPEDGVSSYII